MLSLGISLVDFDASEEHAGVCIWKCEIRLELRREVKSRKSFGRNLHKGDNCYRETQYQWEKCGW